MEQAVQPAADCAVAAERRLVSLKEIPRAIEGGAWRIEADQRDVVLTDGHAPARPHHAPQSGAARNDSAASHARSILCGSPCS
jgi:hypothetical protein